MKPVIVEEIEFYVSDSGETTGMSLSGLARLCGVNLSTIQKLTSKVNNATTKVTSESLESLQDKVFSKNQSTDNNSKIVDSEACAAIIEYYAFDSKAKNEKALFTYRKFAKKGIATWIKEVTGFENVLGKQAFDILKDMYSELLELKQETKELRTLRGKTKTVYLGLDKLLDDLGKEEDDLLPPEDKDSLNRKYTLTEWLREEKDIYDISPSLKSKLAIMVSQNFKALKYKDPEKGIRKHKNGKINNGVSLYSITDFPILDMSLTKILLKHQ